MKSISFKTTNLLKFQDSPFSKIRPLPLNHLSHPLSSPQEHLEDKECNQTVIDQPHFLAGLRKDPAIIYIRCTKLCHIANDYRSICRMIYIKSDDLTVRTMAGSNGGPPPRRVRRCHVSITHAATSRWTAPVRLSTTTASATANQITVDFTLQTDWFFWNLAIQYKTERTKQR